VHTLVRIVAAAGFRIDTGLAWHPHDEQTRGRELEEALRMAAQFPARHTTTLEAPIFGARLAQSNFKAE
jgi:hypothetical protein